MPKIQRSITIDQDVWLLAKQRLGEPVSSFIQKQLELACSLTDEISCLEKEIHEKENELIALRTKLCNLKDNKNTEGFKNNNLEECFEVIKRIISANSSIGKNQLYNIAKLHHVTQGDLINLCREHDFKVIEFFEPDKDKIRNPVTGKY